MTEREFFKNACTIGLVNDSAVKRYAKSARPNAMRRFWAAAAVCVLVGAAAVATIPGARAAVAQFFASVFSARDYLAGGEANRGAEPSIDALVTSAGTASVKITEAGAGYEDYADKFTLTLDEVAYDGTSVFLTGSMPGAVARPFVEAYTGGDTFRAAKNDGSLGGDPEWAYYFFPCENYVTLDVEGGGRYDGELCPDMTEEMDEILLALSDTHNPEFSEDGALITSNRRADELWDAYLKDHDVRFTIECTDPGQTAPPLTGLVSGKLSIRMQYDNVESEPALTVLRADLGTVEIDASAREAVTKQADVGQGVEPAGVHPVTVCQWPEKPAVDDCEVLYYTRMLDYTGASVVVKSLAFTPTDTVLTLHITLPASWTKDERMAGGRNFRFLLDGEEINGRPDGLFGDNGPSGDAGDYLEFDLAFQYSAVSPSAWAKAETLTIVPAAVSWKDLTVTVDNGPKTPFSLEGGAVLTTIVNHTSLDYTEQYEDVAEPLTIRLADYR